MNMEELLEERQAILEEKRLLILPINFLGKVELFYERRGRERMEKYIRMIRKNFGEYVILYWDKERGLTNIGLPPDLGLDLDENEFVWHNIFDRETKRPLLEVIKKYRSLLGLS